MRLLPLRRRGAILLAAVLAADSALGVAACSTTSPDVDGTDATTTETGTSPEAGTDSPAPRPEAGTDAGRGNCSVVKGKCDIVLQDCPAQQECVVSNAGTTECRPVTASQQLPMGRACCPGGPNPCLPGLRCVGGGVCTDGGAPTARCSPACCEGDDQKCGKSDPEGISGACDLFLVSEGNKELHHVCTYRQRCKPFNTEPCKAGEICLVEDKVGSASCVTSFGKTNRQPCSFANECADGMVCLGDVDAGTCHFACLLPGSVHPFDAGVEQGGPGFGGCPAGEKCDIRITDTPDWYRVCSLDGG